MALKNAKFLQFCWNMKLCPSLFHLLQGINLYSHDKLYLHFPTAKYIWKWDNVDNLDFDSYLHVLLFTQRWSKFLVSHKLTIFFCISWRKHFSKFYMIFAVLGISLLTYWLHFSSPLTYQTEERLFNTLVPNLRSQTSGRSRVTTLEPNFSSCVHRSSCE